MCLFSCTRICLCSIWLGGEIRSRLQKVGRRQGHPDPARSGEDLWPHRRGTFSMPASGLSDTPLFTRRGSSLCPLWRAALHADTRPPLHKLLCYRQLFTTDQRAQSKFSLTPSSGTSNVFVLLLYDAVTQEMPNGFQHIFMQSGKEVRNGILISSFL